MKWFMTYPATVPIIELTSLTSYGWCYIHAVATVLSDGGSPISERGFYWTYYGDPYPSGTKVVAGADIVYGSAIYPGDSATINICAFATNIFGTTVTSYGTESTGAIITLNLTVTNITDTSADVNFYLPAGTSSPSRLVYYGISNVYDNHTTTFGNDNDPLTWNLSGLTTGATYQYLGHCGYDGCSIESAIQTFIPSSATTTTTTSTSTTTTTSTSTTSSTTTTTTTTCVDPQILTLITQTNITSSSFTLYADPVTIGCASTLLTNGIEMSVNSDMSDYVSINAPTVDLNTFNINFSNPLVGHSWQIQSSTTYYYRAVMNTTAYGGVSLWYGVKRTVVTSAAATTTTSTTTAAPTTTTSSTTTTTTTGSGPTTTSTTTTTTTTALPIAPLEVYLTEFVYVTCTGFQSNSVVTGDGGHTMLDNGVCYSTSSSPTTSGPHTHDGGDVGAFTSTVGSLSASTLYYVRAYATNSVTTVYSSQYTITTLTPATININNSSTNMVISNVTVEGINLTGDTYPLNTGHSTSGTVCNLGSLPIEVYISSGSASQHIKVTDSFGYIQYASYSGGAATVVISNVNVSSSSAVTVDALPGAYIAPSLPTVITFDAVVTSISTMTGAGNVYSDGGATITSYGVCWDTAQFPTLANDYTTDTLGYPTFVTTSNGGLSEDIMYYTRAFATNSVGTAYGNQVQFIIQYVPVLTDPKFFPNPVFQDTYLHIINTRETNRIEIVTGGGGSVAYYPAPYQNVDIFISSLVYSPAWYGIRFYAGITLKYQAILLVI